MIQNNTEKATQAGKIEYVKVKVGMQYIILETPQDYYLCPILEDNIKYDEEQKKIIFRARKAGKWYWVRFNDPTQQRWMQLR